MAEKEFLNADFSNIIDSDVCSYIVFLKQVARETLSLFKDSRFVSSIDRHSSSLTCSVKLTVHLS